MTYLSVMQDLAKSTGVMPPTTTGGVDATSVKFRLIINEAGKEIARRVDWRRLRKSTTITGAGADTEHALASDYSRLVRGMAVVHDGEPVRGSLTDDEWAGLPPSEGEPRFYYLAGTEIAFWPYLPSGAAVSLHYQSKNWVSGDKDEMTTDGDTALFDERLLLAGSVWRWRRMVGKDFTDHLAEFEAMLADQAQFDGGTRQP